MTNDRHHSFPPPLVLPCWTADEDGVTFLYADDGTLQIVSSEGRRLTTVDLSTASQSKLKDWLA
jgi:hypothetical protein